MSLDERFNAAADKVKKLKTSPNNEELLELYALFKQGTVGNIDTTSPGMFDLKGKAKWSAWKAKEGLTQDAAKEQYIAKVEALVATYGL